MKNNILIIVLIFILSIVFLELYNSKRVLTEIRDEYIRKDIELLDKIESLSSELKQRKNLTDSLIESKQFKSINNINNYYENEKDYIHITDHNDSISWFVAKRRFERFIIE